MRKAGIVIVLIMAAVLFSCASTSTAAKAPAPAPAQVSPAPAAPPAPAADQKKEITRENLVTITSTVQAVDLKTRTVTLKGPRGNVFDIFVDEDVQNLPQVAVGDEVVVTYHEAVSIMAYKATEATVENREIEAASKADPGQKPGGTMIRVVTLTATVDAIDATVPAVTLKGAEGRLFTVIVRDPENLKNVRVGDQIVITYTRAVAVSVEKPAKK
jgi:hypothetical protein